MGTWVGNMYTVEQTKFFHYFIILFYLKQKFDLLSSILFSFATLNFIDDFFPFLSLLQTFRHGFPHSPTALGYDPVQKLLAIGDKSGSLRMYPFYDDKKKHQCCAPPQNEHSVQFSLPLRTHFTFTFVFHFADSFIHCIIFPFFLQHLHKYTINKHTLYTAHSSHCKYMNDQTVMTISFLLTWNLWKCST